MWVCSTTLARGLPAWMRAWMKKAVASTGYLPSTILPAPSAITRSDGVISDQCRPCGLTRNSSSRPGTVMLKWLHTPSLRPCRTAALSAVSRSIRAWVMGSLASIERSPLPTGVARRDDAAKRVSRPSKIAAAWSQAVDVLFRSPVGALLARPWVDRAGLIGLRRWHTSAVAPVGGGRMPPGTTLRAFRAEIGTPLPVSGRSRISTGCSARNSRLRSAAEAARASPGRQSMFGETAQTRTIACAVGAPSVERPPHAIWRPCRFLSVAVSAPS